jgi:hypothetical protein
VFISINFFPTPALRPGFSRPFLRKLGSNPTKVLAGNVIKLLRDLICQNLEKSLITSNITQLSAAPGQQIEDRHAEGRHRTPDSQRNMQIFSCILLWGKNLVHHIIKRYGGI